MTMTIQMELLLVGLLSVVCVITGEMCYKPVCEFTLVVRRTKTMTYRAQRTTYKLGLHDNGTLYLQPNTFTRQVPSDVTIPVDQVHTGDGHMRTVIIINDKFPGPTLEVMEGAEVVVNVKNELVQETMTIHWHGMHMRHNTWMDGMPYISQCPIQPRESFQYRFIADPAGTHWYHSHLPMQRADGLFGALIVHRSQHPPLPPIFYDVITINDWYPVIASEIDYDSPFHLPTGGPGNLFDHWSYTQHIFDGTETTTLRYWSSLINGRGRHGNNSAPLTVLAVKPGTKHRFHLVMATLEYNYRFSIDHHKLTVIETDGHRVQPITVESVQGFMGETFAIDVTADQPVGRYWIRATVIRTGKSSSPVPDGKTYEALAILHYAGADNKSGPNSQPVECRKENPCKVLNCPWVLYHKTWYPNRECVPITHLKLDPTYHKTSESRSSNNDTTELFLNFGFPIGSSINAHRNVLPRAPLFQSPSTWGVTPCSRDCTDKGCFCTHVINIPANRTVQLVFMAYPTSNYSTILPPAMHHIVHVHGHSFQVLKIGYPIANQSTGRPIKKNNDIICDNVMCSRARWRAGAPSGLISDRPPVKDVVAVPAYGYAVVRFKSDNPGYWLLHCHQLSHNVEGMSLILNESHAGLPPAPPHFPTCYDYKITKDEFQEMMVNNRKCAHGQCKADANKAETDTARITWVHLVFTGCLCTFVGVLLNSLLLWLCLKKCKAIQKND